MRNKKLILLMPLRSVLFILGFYEMMLAHA